jgi:hypothetical protein
MNIIGGAVARWTRLPMLGAMGLMLAGTASWGTTIITDLPPNSSPNGQASIAGSNANAQGFTTDANSYTLTDVQVMLINTSGSTLAENTLTIDLFADGGGQPTGSALVSFTGSASNSFGTGTGTYTIAAPSFTLDASTTYWVVFNAAALSGTDLETVGTLNNGTFVSNGATPAGSETASNFTGSGTASWSANGLNQMYAVDATLVVETPPSTGTPEPSTIAYLVGGIAALGAARKRFGA